MKIAPASNASEGPPSDARGDADRALMAAEELASAVSTSPKKAVLPGLLGAELWRKSGAQQVDLSVAEFAEVLETIGTRENFGLAPGREANEKEREAFWRTLHVEELALAYGCALGREAAWERFYRQYREQLGRVAIGMTGSAALGEEIAGALYSELYGLTEREGKRWSPLLRYSGRGSLMGWLRALLAQRRVNQFRKTGREAPLEEVEMAAPEVEQPVPELLLRVQTALQKVLTELEVEERFLLTAYFLDSNTLHEVSCVLGVHEATISRKLKRVTGRIRKELLRTLRTQGLNRRTAEEALGTDPRDIELNLRKLLQNPETGTIYGEEGQR